MKNKIITLISLAVFVFFAWKGCDNSQIAPLAVVQKNDTIRIKVIDTVFVPKIKYRKFPTSENVGEWVNDVENPNDLLLLDTICVFSKDSLVYVLVKDSAVINYYCDTIKNKYSTSIVKMEVQGEILNYSQVTTIDKVPPELIPIPTPCPMNVCEKKHQFYWIKKLFDKWK